MVTQFSSRFMVKYAFNLFNITNIHKMKYLKILPKSLLYRNFGTSFVYMESEKRKAISHMFYENDKKNKETFLAAIEKFRAREKQLRGNIDFIYSALKFLEEYGVHKDIEVYKELLNLMPKGKMVPVNIFQEEFSHYPMHQDCIVVLLEKMEVNGVMPDTEVRDILVNTFGRKSSPFLKFARIRYWMPKMKNACPWPLPDTLPNDSLELAKIAIKQITSVDPTSRIDILQTRDVEDAIDDTWIVSSVSSEQRGLISELPKGESIKVEGPFGVFLRDQRISYFVLRAEAKPFKPPPTRSEIDDVREVFMWMMNERSSNDRELIKKRSIHEQEDGTILGVCATGTSSKDSLLSWVRLLEKSCPGLSDIPVLFTQTSPIGDIIVSSSDNPNDTPSKC